MGDTHNMAKSSNKVVPIQKGPISMDEQYSMAFPREPERYLEDMRHLDERRAGMTLTLHEPKR